MQLRKISATEYHCSKKSKSGSTKTTAPTIKVFSGNTRIIDRLFTIDAGIYKWLILVPHEYLSDLNWNHVFQHGLVKERIKTGNKTPVKLSYITYNTENDGVLFAFK